VTTLLLARTLERRAEHAVRRALGASRWGMALPIVGEALAVALAGAVSAVLVVLAVDGWLDHAFPGLLQARSWFSTVRLVAFSVTLTVLVGGVVAIGPVLVAGRQDLSGLLRVQGPDRSARMTELRALLLCIQVAVALLLLSVGQGVVRSFANVRALHLGFDVDRVVVADVDLTTSGLSRDGADNLLEQLGHVIRRTVGVNSVAVATAMPFLSASGIGTFVEGSPYPVEIGGSTPYFNAVTPSYFGAIGLGIERGRGFRESDLRGAQKVAVVSRNLAAYAWGGLDPIGRCIFLGSDRLCTKVVGVTREGRLMRLRESPMSFIFVPLAQNEFPSSQRVLVVRASDDPEPLVPLIRRAFASPASSIENVRVVAMRDVVAPHWRQWSLGAAVFALLAGLGLGLAVSGIHASVSMHVTARASEFAVRAALGAGPVRLMILAVRPVATATGIGIGVGLAAIIAVSGLAAPMLFEASIAEPVSTIAAGILLVASSAFGVIRPTLRSCKPDLQALLRAE